LGDIILKTVFGFVALMLSSFDIISNFGLVTIISVFFALISEIIVMPAILVLAVRFEKDLTRAEKCGKK
jgi:predicted RND superfamily exporter protein